jgi:hypothetical protein
MEKNGKENGKKSPFRLIIKRNLSLRDSFYCFSIGQIAFLALKVPITSVLLVRIENSSHQKCSTEKVG